MGLFMFKNLVVIVLTTLIFFGTSAESYAHALDQSYVFLNIEDRRVSGHVDMTAADINSALGLSLPTDGSMTLNTIEPHLATIEQYLKQRVRLAVDGGTKGLPVTEVKVADIEIAQYVQYYFSFDDLDREPSIIDFDFSILFDQNPDHRGMAVIETNWKTGTFNNESVISLVFEPGREQQSLKLEEASVWTGIMTQVRSGIHHIWIGTDHILFLLALLLPAVVVRLSGKWEASASFKDAFIHVVKIVTVFTVAHTITLSLAALNAVSLSSRLIESIIAISIAVAALDIIKPIFKRRIWLIVFIFGLFHGFGFASVLGEIGIPSSYMVHSLLGFNVGVEIGQLAIVGVLFPILFILARFQVYTRFLLPAGAILLIAISMYWFVERAFNIDLPAGAIVNSIMSWFS